MDADTPKEPNTRFRLKYFIIVVLIFTVVPFAAVGLNDLYRSITDVLERQPPVIQLIEVPRGIGLSPVSIKFNVVDNGAGLDEIVVRLRQRGAEKELQRLSLRGKRSHEIILDFSAEDGSLIEGVAMIDVRAFDRSFWSNRAESSLPLRVDFRKPKIEVLSTQHNARIGGSQMVFYKTFDEDLALSGVKVGSQIFLGYPATSVDKDFSDPNVKVAIYALDLELDKEARSHVKLFAEDKVGNAVSEDFYNKVQDRTSRDVPVKLSEDFMRDRIVDLAGKARNKIRDTEESGGTAEERLIQDFKLVNERLRLNNEAEITSLVLKSPRHEAYWDGPFVRQSSTVQQPFGNLQVFSYEGKVLGKARSLGDELLLPRGQDEVYAANGGIVAFAQDVGIYGWAVGIDHGLGVVSIYARLESPLVQKGAVIEKGQVIGKAGRTGFARNKQLYFEMRVQGVPVDPAEWFDAAWFYGHLGAKIKEVKKILGIPIYVPLR